MRRHLRFVLLLLRMRLSRAMVFRLRFFGAFFVDGTMFLLQLLMFGVIYAQVDAIGDWSGPEMIVFVGTFSLLNALNMVLYFFGVIRIPGMIRDGSLDHYLTKPISPLLRLTFEEIDLGSLPLVLLSIGIVAYGAAQLHIAPSAMRVAGYALWVLVMTLLYYDVELILRALTFHFLTSQADRVEELLVLNMKLPGTLFRGGLKLLFYLALPYGLMATVPSQFLMGVLTPPLGLYALLVAIGFTVLTLWFWRFSLRRYKSASS